MKPKVKNHYRAHQLSVWLRLIPELHRAGMDDTKTKHNLFRDYADKNIYDGFVRADPLRRITDPINSLKNLTTEFPIITTNDMPATTCISVIQSTNLRNVHNLSSDTLANLDTSG